MNAFGNIHEARQHRRLQRLCSLSKSVEQVDESGQFEREPVATETMTSEQYQQLQKLQRMAGDLLEAIDEVFPYKTKEAVPIARRKQFSNLPKAQADSVAKFRSEVALVAKNGFVEHGSLKA